MSEYDKHNQMLIDEATIKVMAGDGGKGAVAFNRNIMSLGPVGGSGGRGGSIYFEGISDLNALNQFRHKKVIASKDGMNGRGQFRDGSDGQDIILRVPVGTVIHTSARTTEVLKVGDKILVARGGQGGRGNFHFRSSTNTSPKEFEEGKPGEHFTVKLELKLIADVGLIGLPNAGKSSLLNELTKAKSKVANYPFTTLEPNLGSYYGLILADIPGLIEGASKGKGLGIKFLRHIERTKILFHLISAESTDSLKDYQTVIGELGKHNEQLLAKTEYVFISKSDMVSAEEMDQKIAALREVSKKVLPISIYDDASLEKVKKILIRLQNPTAVKP